MAPNRNQPKVPPAVERVVKALVVTDKAVSLYPHTSTIPRETATMCANVMAQGFKERSEVRLVVTKNGLVCDGAPVFPDQPAYENFATALYNRHLADVRFHVGIDARSIIGFLSLVQTPPEDILAAGGFETRLWDLNIGNISVTEVHVSIVDASDAAHGQAEEIRDMSRGEVDELLALAYGGRPRDQLTVARFLSNPGAVSRYLSETYSSGGGVFDLASVGERFAELAEVAYEVGTGDGRMEMLKALGESFAELDPALRHSLLVEEVFPEARTNEALAAVIRQMDLDEVCRMLVENVEADDISRDGLARAIRNLSMISMSDRDEVVDAAGAAMRGAGLGEALVSDVMEGVVPSRITVREPARPAGQVERPTDAIFKLMDLAPLPEAQTAGVDDPGLQGLRDEVRRGITDGDVIMALVSLVGLDSRDAQFATTMSMLEDSLGVLIERGEIDVAADAADALMAASTNEALDASQRSRLRGAIKRFTRPSDIQAMAQALRLYPPGSTEHEAARRLLEALGPLAVDPLLEQLAAEEDMGVRKLLVDLISSMALKYIAELGRHVSDSRWFVVRNVVSILSSTKSSAILPYIEKIVRHPETRVRREVIRALSTIHDRRAQDMLIAGLSDTDGQNVQLAARYLGALGVTPAIPVLEQVARGEGRGNRDVGPRVEAVEALGRMGASAALGTLEGLARRGAIMGGARGREVRAAAEAAIDEIKSAKGGKR